MRTASLPLVLLLLGAIPAGAGEGGERARLTVIFGEKVSEFRLSEKRGVYAMEYRTGGAEPVSVPLREGDGPYLMGRFHELPAEDAPSGDCGRRRIRAEIGGSGAETCLEGGTPRAKAALGLANLLTTLVR